MDGPQILPESGGRSQRSIEALAQGCAVLCDFRNVAEEVYRYCPRPPILQVGGDQGVSAAEPAHPSAGSARTMTVDAPPLPEDAPLHLQDGSSIRQDTPPHEDQGTPHPRG